MNVVNVEIILKRWFSSKMKRSVALNAVPQKLNG